MHTFVFPSQQVAHLNTHTGHATMRMKRGKVMFRVHRTCFSCRISTALPPTDLLKSASNVGMLELSAWRR